MNSVVRHLFVPSRGDQEFPRILIPQSEISQQTIIDGCEDRLVLVFYVLLADPKGYIFQL